jgi:hypothetical protein
MTQLTHDEFTHNLVFAMLGIKLGDYENSKQDEIVGECFAVYREFTLDFFMTNYPEFDLNNFPDVGQSKLKDLKVGSNLKPKLDNCYQAFLVELSKSWEV